MIQTFKEIDTWVRAECPKCPICQGDLGELESYNCSGGIEIKSVSLPQWVYFTCLGCGHKWMLWKLKNYVASLERLRSDVR